ncbi:cupin domain-containing protein [Rudaea sp.]|uniref:cupin domain-containing protein n=1 Tax=Rudaea sp. TaxID=2136325 RepID=UPI00378513D3
MKRALLIAVASGLSIAAICRSAAADEPAHVMFNPADIKWGDTPPAFPHGAKMAVLYGDPARQGMFVVRVKMPPGYIVPAHWHSSDEVVTVVSGSGAFGLGDKFDPKLLHSLSPGSLVVAPARHNHFATTKTGAVIQISATGPFDMTYVNPADDPRNKSSDKK